MGEVTRFAPSPNGALHLGHAYSAIRAHDLAAANEGNGSPAPSSTGRFLLRIEDIDGARSRPELAEDYRADLAWLGLEWHEVKPQSARLASYAEAARQLYDRGLLYRCNCTRSEIAERAQKTGPEGLIYPGTCRPKQGTENAVQADKDADAACAARDFANRSLNAQGFGEARNSEVASASLNSPYNDAKLPPPGSYAWRLDMRAARAEVGPLTWYDARLGAQQATPEIFGDVVLWRKDAPASYHLAATLDDAADGVTLVTRGADLISATHIHRLLQALLKLPVPRWHHHRLLYGADGRKLAKRRGAAALSAQRHGGEDGLKLAERLRRGDFPAGISAS